MCGIVGYIGKKDAGDIIFQGLKRLEYRGYDSAGIAVYSRKKIKTLRRTGPLSSLGSVLEQLPAACCGIGHTRWATHGGVKEQNAHPHVSMNGKTAIVHNGIIDNHAEIRDMLKKKGYRFNGETDSELIAHLIELYLEDSPEQAVRMALSKLKGTYGLLVLFSDYPELIIGARQGSPMVLGLGEKDMILASDPAAFVGKADRAVYLGDGEMVTVTSGKFELRNTADKLINRGSEEVNHAELKQDKLGYSDYLEKEIYEQPDSVCRAMANGARLNIEFGTARLDGLNLKDREFFGYRRVYFIGMGTAMYAGMYGALLMEKIAGIPAYCMDASELRYMNHRVEEDSLYFAISQSGETADTVFTVRELQNRGARVLGIVNTVGSSLARMCDGGTYIHAGIETSVASTKVFTGQLTVLSMLALMFGRMKMISISDGKIFAAQLQSIPEKIGQILGNAETVRKIARDIKKAGSMLFLGRGLSLPIAMEGALKVKELSYIHAEAFSAGNLKHGPLALVKKDLPVCIVAPKGDVFEKVAGNIQEVKARGAKCIIISNAPESEFAGLADYFLPVPDICEELSPLLTVVPLQLLAMYLARELGCNVDMPRNLAKSVTTE